MKMFPRTTHRHRFHGLKMRASTILVLTSMNFCNALELDAAEAFFDVHAFQVAGLGSGTMQWSERCLNSCKVHYQSSKYLKSNYAYKYKYACACIYMRMREPMNTHMHVHAWIRCIGTYANALQVYTLTYCVYVYTRKKLLRAERVSTASAGSEPSFAAAEMESTRRLHLSVPTTHSHKNAHVCDICV